MFILKKFATFPLIVAGIGGVTAVATPSNIPPTLTGLGLFFLKVGSVLFGSGYVLVAFLEGDLVQGRGWLTRATSIRCHCYGSIYPLTVLSTATFIGYQILGVSGAIVATLAIFFPSFIFVLLLNPLIPKLRQSAWAGAFLDAINASAVALMVAVIFNLALVTWFQPYGNLPFNLLAIILSLISAVLLLRFQVNSTWLILAGALIGFLFNQLG
jgi:chromate transporter